MKKLFLFFCLSLICLISIWVLLNFKHLKRIPQILPAFQAKEMCSCLFVVEQSENYCFELVQNWIGSGTPTIDHSSKHVSIKSNWGVVREAQWVDARHGCRLVAAKTAN